MNAKIVYEFDDLMRLIADDLKRRGFDQASSSVGVTHCVRSLGHAKYAGSEIQEIALREIQVSHWIDEAKAGNP